jgi:hypothetical protein
VAVNEQSALLPLISQKNAKMISFGNIAVAKLR